MNKPQYYVVGTLPILLSSLFSFSLSFFLSLFPLLCLRTLSSQRKFQWEIVVIASTMLPETSIVKKIHKWKPFTGRPIGRQCQERPEEEETHKMDRTSPRSPQMERNCWEGQDSTRVVARSKKKKKKKPAPCHLTVMQSITLKSQIVYVLCICMYIKYFCCCALCWFLWYICFEETSLQFVCIYVCIIEKEWTMYRK